MASKKRRDDKYLTEMTWEEKAKVNPLYGVMSVDEFVDSSAVPTEQELERFFRDGQEKVARWIVPWLQQVPGFEKMRVLEFGCGMGRLLKSLAESGIKCSGVDISPTMISWAQKYLSKNIEARVLDSDGVIPFPDNHFDFVFSYAVFQHIKKTSILRKAITEISRVLKPEGLTKLQFAMLYPYIRSNLARRGDTYAFETVSIVHGWTRRFGLPLWRIRFYKHTHWGGTRPGYLQLIREFARNGVKIYGVENDPSNSLITWFYGIKKGRSPTLIEKK